MKHFLLKLKTILLFQLIVAGMCSTLTAMPTFKIKVDSNTEIQNVTAPVVSLWEKLATDYNATPVHATNNLATNGFNLDIDLNHATNPTYAYKTNKLPYNILVGLNNANKKYRSRLKKILTKIQQQFNKNTTVSLDEKFIYETPFVNEVTRTQNIINVVKKNPKKSTIQNITIKRNIDDRNNDIFELLDLSYRLGFRDDVKKGLARQYGHTLFGAIRNKNNNESVDEFAKLSDLKVIDQNKSQQFALLAQNNKTLREGTTTIAGLSIDQKNDLAMEAEIKRQYAELIGRWIDNKSNSVRVGGDFITGYTVDEAVLKKEVKWAQNAGLSGFKQIDATLNNNTYVPAAGLSVLADLTQKTVAALDANAQEHPWILWLPQELIKQVQIEYWVSKGKPLIISSSDHEMNRLEGLSVPQLQQLGTANRIPTIAATSDTYEKIAEEWMDSCPTPAQAVNGLSVADAQHKPSEWVKYVPTKIQSLLECLYPASQLTNQSDDITYLSTTQDQNDAKNKATKLCLYYALKSGKIDAPKQANGTDCSVADFKSAESNHGYEGIADAYGTTYEGTPATAVSSLKKLPKFLQQKVEDRYAYNSRFKGPLFGGQDPLFKRENVTPKSLVDLAFFDSFKRLVENDVADQSSNGEVLDLSGIQLAEISKQGLNDLAQNNSIDLTKIKTLNLSDNVLTKDGLHVDFLDVLPNLEILIINNNSTLTELPDGMFYKINNGANVGRVQNLHELYLVNNGFVGLDTAAFAGLDQSKNLHKIDLSQNKFDSTSLPLMGGLTLAFLKLEKCGLDNVPADTFSKMPDLTQNPLSDSCDSDELKKNLKELYVRDNKLDFTQDEFKGLGGSESALEFLDATNNEVKHLDDVINKDFRNLKHLFLDCNNLAKLIVKNGPVQVEAMKVAQNGGNQQVVAQAQVQANNNQVAQLNMVQSGDQLVKDDEATTKLLYFNEPCDKQIKIGDDIYFQCQQLETLSLNNNQLENIEWGDMVLFPALKYLDLSFNEISGDLGIQTDAPCGALYHVGNTLEYLNLVGNKLGTRNTKTRGSENLSPFTFVGLSKLKHLNLTGNQLLMIPNRLFATLHSLEELYLAGNNPKLCYESENKTGFKHSVIEPEAFLGLMSLKVLDLSYNAFSKLPEFKVSFKAIVADATGDVLEYLKFVIQDINSKVDRNNEFDDVKNDFIKDNCKFDDNDSKWVLALKKLVRYFLNSPLIYGQSSVEPQLERLYLQKNKIFEAKNETFVAFKKLHTLDLTDNNMQRVESRTFINIPRLKKLKLKGNNLMSFARINSLYGVARYYAAKNLFNYSWLGTATLAGTIYHGLQAGEYFLPPWGYQLAYLGAFALPFITSKIHPFGSSVDIEIEDAERYLISDAGRLAKATDLSNVFDAVKRSFGYKDSKEVYERSLNKCLWPTGDFSKLNNDSIADYLSLLQKAIKNKLESFDHVVEHVSNEKVMV